MAFFLPKGTTGPIEGIFVVVERKDSYCLVASWNGRYLLYDGEGKYRLFSILRILGDGKEFSFSHFEQQFDFGEYLRTKGVHHILEEKSVTFVFDSPLQLADWFWENTDRDVEAVVSSLLFGSSLYELGNYHQLAQLGLLSSLAIGGFQLSFLLSLIHRLMGKKHRKLFALMDLAILVPFLFLSSFRFAIRRIFLMHLAFAINGRRKGKRLNGLELLSLVALVMLACEPFAILSSSFYYSFPFLFFIRTFPITKNRKKSFLPFFLTMTFFFMPLRLQDTYSFSIMSPIIQIFAIPLTHLIFLLSLVAFAIPSAMGAVESLVRFLFKVADVSYVHSPILISGSLSIPFVLLFYSLLFFAFLFRFYRLRLLFRSFFFMSALLLSSSFIPDLSSHCEIYFVDVNQGDCTLVRNGQKSFLIDTGGSVREDMSANCLVPFLQSLKITCLEAVVITHYDWDHYGALESLRESLPIKRILDSSDFLSEKDHTIDLAGINVTNLNDYEISTDSNDQSAVLFFEIGGRRILIMGDAPSEVEEKIIEEHGPLSIDILRLGHHGSESSSSLSFLAGTSPKVAIISVGEDNSYGHPSETVLSRLKMLDIPVRRTDQEGTIHYDFSDISDMIKI